MKSYASALALAYITFITAYSWELLRHGNLKQLPFAAILDIAFAWKARQTMESFEKIRHSVKLAFAVIWTIVLPICYAYSRRKYTCLSSQYKSWLDEWCFTSYMVAVGLFLMTNAIEMVLFFVPAIRKFIEISNHRIFSIFSWKQVISW